jgi:uncharacterized coiled-coil protein SlyX
MTMKKLTHLFFIFISLISLSTYAQTSNKTLNYQAVILDPNAIDIPGASITGQPLNKGKVCLRFSLLNAQGGLDYEETQQVTTDEFGLVSVAIGVGTQGNSNSIYKSFASVQWNANMKSLKVSLSYDGCNSFKQVSTQIFNYTPYALYAEAVDYKNVRDSPTKISQFSNDAGYLIPKDLDPLKTDIQANSSKIATANQSIADNKQASDAAFLVVNQSITSLDKQVADNTGSISTINTKITDQQNQISDNRNQIAVTNNTLNAQIGGLQGQINNTNNTVSNLSGVAEMQSNKSTLVNLGGANPSDQLYPSQKAAKSYIDNAINDAVGSGVPDATTLAPGKVQLSGDLAGTATNPTVPALANKANLASPDFTGTPTAPTQTTGDNSTKLATTAFVTNSLAASAGGVPYTGATGAVNLGAYDLTVNGITVGIGGGNDIRNIAVGSGALSNNTSSGLKNTASGYQALNSNIEGDDNTASGYRALRFNIGNFNTASGSLALGANTSGGFNTAFGLSALSTNTTGSNNTAIGNLADVGSANLTNATAIGNGAIVAASNTIQLGNTAVTTIGGQVAWTAASDRRIKKNIVNSNYGLATVLKLRPVEYNLNSNDLRQVGFIAQEVQKLVPEVVTGKEGDLSKGEILGITYSNLVPVLTKAIQEQQKQIEEQNSKIAAQQKQIEELIKLVKGQ